MIKITATAPMRIDFAGGTIDLPPLFLFHYPALTVNAAINVKAQVEITPSDQLTIVSKDQQLSVSWPNWQAIEWQSQPMLELVCRIIRSFEPPPVKIEISSAAPAGSGLGGSSVIAIALVAALAELTNTKLSQSELVEWAKSIETQAIKVPTGYQDYWAAVYGGLQAYQVDLRGKLIRTELASPAFRQTLQDQLMLVYVGKPHFSGANNWQLFKQHIDNQNGVPAFFDQLKDHGVAMAEAMNHEDLAAAVAVLNKDWQVRKTMLPTMTTPEIESLTKKVMAAGASALRVCGAGAGGCALLTVDPAKRSAVEAVVKELKMITLDATISDTGVSVSRT